MWSPTHVEVTVQSARGLITKGKNGTNDAFVTIALGKEKFQTSVKKKADANEVLEWHEKCELAIPKQGNKAEIILTVLHHTGLKDNFLGSVYLPLAEMDVYERPRNKWYALREKPGSSKSRDLGELEVKIVFRVKAGSMSDLSKKEKHKSSLGQLSQAAQSFGGSLISISSLEKSKGLKKLASRFNKIRKGKNKDENNINDIQTGSSKQTADDADPGVVSDGDSDDDFTLDELSHKGSGYSVNLSTPSTRSVENINFPGPQGTTPPPSKPPRNTTFSLTPTVDTPVKAEKEEKKSPPKPPKESGVMDSVKRRLSVLSSSSLSSTKEVNEDEEVVREVKTHEHQIKNVKDSSSIDSSKSGGFKGSLERIIIGKENTRSPSPNLSPDILKQFVGKSREELIEMIVNLQGKLELKEKHQRDLEDYLDDLLVRVMDNSPLILQNPYMSCKTEAHFI